MLDWKKKKEAVNEPAPEKRRWFAKGPRSKEIAADVTDVESVEVALPENEVPHVDFEAPAAASIEAESGIAENQEKPSKLSRKARRAEAARQADIVRPIKILIGFLPESSQKDTYYYMLGVAEKNLDSENIGWAGLFPFENGFVYEIHEGGNGRSYTESILEHFRSLPPFSAEENHYVFLRTATRTIRVERTANGVYSVMLPETDLRPESDFVRQGKKLAPLVEKRTGLFLAGITIFLSSLIALTGAYITRYQPYTPAKAKLDRVPAAMLPFAQWQKVLDIPQDDFVVALRYSKGAWVIERASQKQALPATPSASASAPATDSAKFSAQPVPLSPVPAPPPRKAAP